ncbi:MAG: seryl-tRNA synthetase [Candidatus Eremiobacteraeota bacterium]|nr:seryl-tRNA synthetase [Candidatus Eremiobacteraeota bacterium]
MLSIELLRREPDHVRVAARRRGGGAEFVDRVLRLDRERRAALTAVEALKAEKNGLSAEIAKAADKKAAAAELRPRIAALDARIVAEGERLPELDREIDAELAQVPNVLDGSVPDGSDEHANELVRAWGELPTLDFTPKPHWELGEALGILDFERAAKLSGARFSVLRGAGARLSRALVSFFHDRAARNGYTENAPPYLVTRDTMWSTGQLTKFSDQMYTVEGDGPGDELFLIPTAEVPLTALHRDELLDNGVLPLRYTAYTPCFRKEAGAAGKDTRGLMRQHQFEKVELVWLTRPERSFDALETLTRNAAELLEELGLAHRVMLLCAGDTGFNAAKTYDIEVWLPGANAYREISSCSNCTDFQARRSNIRFRREAGVKPELVHTLNGSGLAVGRTLLALLENHQRADGGVNIPEALRPFTGFASIEPGGSTR